MSMQAASLEILDQVDVPSPVARAIVQVFDIEFTEARKTLATKQDLIELRHCLGAKIESRCHRLELQMERFRGRLQADMANMESGLVGNIHAAKSDCTRHLYVALAAQTGLMFGAFYFFVTYMMNG